MASFGESFVDAFAAGTQLRRQREEDARKRKLEAALAAAVKPGDIIGPKGRAPTYDATRFSTDAGVSIGDRPLADFQGAQPAAALAPAPQAMPPIAPAPGMRAAAQLTPELAGQAGIVRPTALAGGPPQPAPVAPSRGMASVAALPVAPLGQGMGVPADTVALPDPSKMVFYRDPTTGKGMAVEKGRERVATDADAAISAASIYMANGDVQTASKMMREAYALREASFKDEQITLQRALISAGVQNGGMTPAAIAQFAEVYNDKVEDGVKLTPSVGPDGGLALGVGSDNADTPMLWVNPTDGSMSRTPVYVTGAQAGAYLQTLITGNYADYQANIVQAQTAAATAARLDKQLANDTRRVDAAVKAADLDEAHWNELRSTRMAALDGTEAQTEYTRANTRRTDAQSVYEFGADYNPGLGARQPAVGQAIASVLKDIPGVVITRSGIDARRLPLSAPNTYHDQGAAVDFTLAPGADRRATEAAIKSRMGAGYEIIYHPENNSFHVEPSPQWRGPGGETAPTTRQFRSPADRDKAVSSAWTEINRQLTAQQAAGMAPQDLKALELSLRARYQEQTGVSFDVPSRTALASGRALGLAPSYVADLRTKGSTPGVIEAAFAKYPQMADEIAKLAGPDAVRAYRQRVASPPPAVTRAAGGPAVRDTTITGALGRAMYNAGTRSGEAQAKADLTSAKKYAPPLIARYREARRNGGQPLTTGQVAEMMYWFRRNPAFRSMLPADMRTFLDRQIAAQQ